MRLDIGTACMVPQRRPYHSIAAATKALGWKQRWFPSSKEHLLYKNLGRIVELVVGSGSGYTRHGNSDDALNIFKEMQQEGIHPDQVTFMCILKACSNIAALEEGRQIHAHIIRSGFELDAPVGNTLINMLYSARAWPGGSAPFPGNARGGLEARPGHTCMHTESMLHDSSLRSGQQNTHAYP